MYKFSTKLLNIKVLVTNNYLKDFIFEFYANILYFKELPAYSVSFEIDFIICNLLLGPI